MNLKLLSMASFFFLNNLLFNFTLAQPKSPDEIYGDLFAAVQTSDIFTDYKTFPDCIPLYTPKKIMAKYASNKSNPTFDLKEFVFANFRLPDSAEQVFTTDSLIGIDKHIESLWNTLNRNATISEANTSLIVLPKSFVVPGGRFRELFYWDSYFIMLGLQATSKQDLLSHMMDNFKFLIDSVGFIPNGNRTYFLSRSQPPFFSLMVDLFIENDINVLPSYLPYLNKEYEFWMKGSQSNKTEFNGSMRTVQMKKGETMNRYWDNDPKPRPEAYGKDINYAKSSLDHDPGALYRHIRAACESGWDFSSRWNKIDTTMTTIHTTDIVPVDLNCLLFYLEHTISRAYYVRGLQKKGLQYAMLASKRKVLILKYCWNEEEGFFMDYDFKTKKHTPSLHLAAAFPLYFNIATFSQAEKVSRRIEKDFLKDGGFVTTLVKSPYQWDSPNGWAPLQWITVKGLINYKYHDLARIGATRWLELNEKVFKNTGKMLEKYNVEEVNERTGGGEYALQDGFGWTNGVYQMLKKIYP